MNITTSGIIMGVGAPNICRDGKKTMCAILLSEDLGFLRIYPLPAGESFPVWATLDVDLEKSQTDSRRESYKVRDYKLIAPSISCSAQKREILNACILKSGMIDCQDYMNSPERRGSIAMVKLNRETITASMDMRAPASVNDDEEFGWIMAQAQHWQKPYLQWKSEQGKVHKTHLVAREVYEGLRKNPEQPWNIYNNLQIGSPDWEHWLLMGNMRNHRNVWVGVHLHRLKKSTSGSIPLFSMIPDGRLEGWPYCEQESSNVPVVGNQPMLFTTEDMTLTNCRGNMAMIA
jgi:hypothetical protein